MQLLMHIYAVKNLMNKGVASDDSRYSNALIAHILKIIRATLIERKADKYYYISEQSFQSLCMPLELGKFDNCCIDFEDEDCFILKSVYKIPKTLNTRWGDFIKITDLVGNVVSKTSVTANKFAKYSLTNSPQKIGWFIHDQHLYIINNKKLELILINALFSDPTEIENLNCKANDLDCPSIYEEEFPIDSDLIDPLYKMTIEYLQNAIRIPEDNENNSRSNEMTNDKE